MNLIPRPQSVITGLETLEHLYTLKNFPVFMGCTDSAPISDEYADMQWAIDLETGIIQLEQLIPLEILYQAPHMDGTGPSWNAYYEALAAFIQEEASPKNVLEIGGGAGKLARLYTDSVQDAHWTIIEPNPLNQNSERIHVINGFFSGHDKFDQKFDTIVFSQVLEHAYYPDQFLNDIGQYLPVGSHLFFGHPDLERFLREKYTNALNFEHTTLITDYFVDYLLAKNGFSIIAKQHFNNNHFFYHAIRTQKRITLPLVNHYTTYKQIFQDFINYHLDLVSQLNNKISDHHGPVYLFGAHIFAQYLLAFGLDESKIYALLDNSLIKQGKRLYGTKLYVNNIEDLKNQDNAAVVVKVGIYRNEIIKQIKEINSRVTILE